MKNLIYLCLLSMTLLVACGKEDDPIDNPGDCSTTNYTYTADIKSIFDGSCATAGCHTTAAKAGGHDLSNYAGVIATGTAKIVASVDHTGGVAMPYLQPKLPDATIQKIKCWVSKGAIQ